MPQPFHLAIPVTDLARARDFYGTLLGCAEGRSDERWVDFNFFGHQLVCHHGDAAMRQLENPVDGDQVPVPHFGVVLEMNEWQTLRDRLLGADVDFVVAPRIRFAGQPGEQATMFLLDPCGNALEFKAFANVATQLFAK